MELQRFWEWVKAIRFWWIAAIGFLPSAADLAGSEWVDRNIDSPLAFAATSLGLLLFGSYWAYRHLSLEKEAAVARLADEAPHFLVRAPVLPTGITEAIFLERVYLVNRGRRALNLRFSLKAGDEVCPGRPLRGRTIDGQQPIPNPKHIEPGENHGGFLSFHMSPVDATPFVIDGVELVVVDEQTHGFELAIPLPTSEEGFAYPDDADGAS